MKRIFTGILFLLFPFFAGAQFKVQFLLRSLPSYHKPSDRVFLVGNFNNWNPGDERMILKTVQGRPGITIELPKGMYEFKFTKGSWNDVECGNNGFPTANRMIQVESDTTIESDIEHWSGHFPKAEKQSTASANVTVLDTAFFIPQLNRYRRIWIYLPSDYRHSKEKYPVLYMHDGQNVFDNATAGFGEWGVDEALDTLGEKFRKVIVVAIDNGKDKRLNEYAPYNMEKYGKGEGDLYVDFLARTLKPYIDKRFRTKKDEKYTWIAGSSMGGIISFHAILKYPKVFGAAGVFSPAFWINPQMKTIDPRKAKKVKGKIYFFAGQKESEEMVPDMLHVFEQMRLHSKAKMKSVIKAEGKHNEATWRAEFPDFFKWLIEKL